MKRICGIDASTTTIGLSIIDYQDGYVNLFAHEYFKPPKIDEIEKLAAVREFIFEKLNQYNPDDVALEDIILFMKGFSTAKTVTRLAVLNRTVALAIFNQSGKSPCLLNVLKIRHLLKENKILPSKEEIPELVARHLNISFPWRINKKGKIIVENYDVADSIAVGLAFVRFTSVVEKPVGSRSKGRRKKK